MELRASDAERERAADVLRHAAGEGRLTVDELDDRLTTAYAATTRSELVALTADVAEVREDRVPVCEGEGGERNLISVMGGADRKGHWRLAPRVNVINVMGGADLDLNEAELSAPVTEMRVFSFWGGSDIHVPDGLNVDVSRFALMGGNDVDLGPAQPDPGGPVLRIRLIAIMGGNNVTRGRKLSRRERREIRRGPPPPPPPHRLHRP